jgi:hypothetical protein
MTPSSHESIDTDSEHVHVDAQSYLCSNFPVKMAFPSTHTKASFHEAKATQSFSNVANNVNLSLLSQYKEKETSIYTVTPLKTQHPSAVL